MKKFRKISLSLFFVFLLFACTQSEGIDMQKPEIDLTIQEASPLNCNVFYFGETITLHSLLKDNVEIGTYSVDIHHNFDHHSHSTEVEECALLPKKVAINPFVFIKGYGIPVGQTSHQTATEIELPTGNELGLFDEGDYHFFISLTDKQGWSTQKGISIKIFHKLEE